MTCKGMIFAVGMESNAHLPMPQVSGFDAQLRATPKIHFALAMLMQAGVRQVLIGASEANVVALHTLLGDGSSVGAEISYLLLDRNCSIEQSLSVGIRYFANCPVLFTLPGVCCSHFILPDLAHIPKNGFISFRMQSGRTGGDDQSPSMFLIGNRSLHKIRRRSVGLMVGSKDVEQFRRAWMTQLKYRDMDLTEQCVFVNFEDGVTLEPSSMNHRVLHKLLQAMVSH